MVLMVVSGDINSPAHPDVIKLGDVIEEPRDCVRPARVPCYAAVKSNTHHLGRLCPFCVKVIKGISEVAIKLLARVKALGRGKAHVIDVERVRNNQMRLALSVFDYLTV